MALDERYGCAYHRVASVLGGDPLMRPETYGATRKQRAAFLCLSPVVLTAFSPRPTIETRWRALAPQETLRETPVVGLEVACYSDTQNGAESWPHSSATPCSLDVSVAQREGHRSTTRIAGINLALIKSRGRKNGASVSNSKKVTYV